MSGASNVRRPIVAGNWKMNYGPSEAHDFLTDILPDLEAVTGVDRVICPPAISISAAHALTSASGVALGAQNMYDAEKGAFTGEISPLMLRGLCDYVIVGHSERRALFGETDEFVNRKALSAFAHGLKPIVCVGERLEDRDANLTERVISAQVRGSLANLPTERLGELVVAYEPVWAIGTGRAATAEDARDVIAIIRALLGELYGSEMTTGVRVQYGGSVTAANAAELAAVPEIDGALVGGASLTADFVAIARAFANAKGVQ
ncbi:MAG TPA: triose-phosphate isomerase [Ktedonobacterales bacterium]|jgi:triosephosphate isomerase|nr:triose-phosphate isomerase [Ktedonobacterales bacterium]